MATGKLWEFFENLDEMVYVTDWETNALIYMNRHLREGLGYRSHADYLGKMCYQVLQGRQSPCPFCTNRQLEEGAFVSWTHRNPVLNKRFLIKDGLIVQDARKYRIEIAIDADSSVVNPVGYYYTQSELILNECLKKSFEGADPEESVMNILRYIGERFHCDRAYIFEMNPRGTIDNTYEWCADGVESQKDVLQDIALSGIGWWLEKFQKDQVVIVDDLDRIRQDHAETYAILKPQNISSLVAGSIKINDQIVGIVGADNPDKALVPFAEQLLKVVGFFLLSLFRRRDSLKNLKEMSYRDPLTGALNRNALNAQYDSAARRTMGLIYCDVIGLKNINDSMGHEVGDQVICQVFEMLRTATRSDRIYRTGGDEFVILCPDMERRKFRQLRHRLCECVQNSEKNVAVGCVWTDQLPQEMDQLISRADKMVYRNKRRFYPPNTYQSAAKAAHADAELMITNAKAGSLQSFLKIAHCDLDFFIKSLSQNNDSSYFYIGDMQKNLFYISDNMRDDFGFKSNVVPDLPSLWSYRISSPEFRTQYLRDISDMLEKKRTVHDLRYQVKDIKGNNLWIRCYGRMVWDDSNTHPLLFSGRINCQDKYFVVDPITNLPREISAFKALRELKEEKKDTFLIGIGLQGMTELNSIKGRIFGDQLLARISSELVSRLSDKLTLFRLEGARYMAIAEPSYVKNGCDGLIGQIKNIVKHCYEKNGVNGSRTCVFGVLNYPKDVGTDKDTVENLTMLLRLAKQEKKKGYLVYSNKNAQLIKDNLKMALELDEDVAERMKNFRVMLQPLVSADDGKMSGGEMLLRWRFQDKEISPAEFIPLLERSGTICMAGRWVLEQAIAACVRLRTSNPEFFITVNISMRQLSDDSLIPFLEETMQKYHLDGSGIVMELTESSLDEAPERLNQFIAACEKMKVRIALDDFGSGYSSLRMLLQYPMQIIKLDKALIKEVLQSEEKQRFIRSIVFACHQFKKVVCAEGVEKAEQSRIMRKIGCDMIQGFHYFRPMELSDAYELIIAGKHM